MKNLAFCLAEFSYYLLADRNEAKKLGKKPAQQHSIKQSTCLSSGRSLRCNQSQEHLFSNAASERMLLLHRSVRRKEWTSPNLRLQVTLNDKFSSFDIEVGTRH
jgi:hypothetical protein